MDMSAVMHAFNALAFAVSIVGNAAVVLPQAVWLIRDMRRLDKSVELFDQCMAMAVMLQNADKDFWTYRDELDRDLKSLRYFKSAGKRCALCRIFIDKWECRIATGRCLNLKREKES